jgi:murein DD-endopeptidase MepM/ murein hydrolase activator NlpD
MAKTINKYRMPAKNIKPRDIKFNSPSHEGLKSNAIDFLMNEGTGILAAADGVVVFAKDSSNVGGNNESYLLEDNCVILRHANGEYSKYSHLKFRSCTARLGQSVKAGDLIAQSGNTGFTEGDRLHFEVFRTGGENPDPNADFETLEVVFGQ